MDRIEPAQSRVLSSYVHICASDVDWPQRQLQHSHAFPSLS